MSLATRIVHVLQELLPPDVVYPLHEPCFAGNEWALVKDCLDTGWVSSVGGYVDRFEEMLATFTNANRAVVTVNGTAALSMALILVGVKPGDEVLLPSLTFVGTANAARQLGATPHFVDSELRTLGMNPEKLASHLEDVAVEREGMFWNRLTGARIAAIVPVHVFGHPADIPSLQKIAERYRLPMVEDAAEALGSRYQGRHLGTFGSLGVLSFNGNKIITTGGGGAILANDPHLAEMAKHLTTTAKKPHPWEYFHDMAGYNYRLPNLNAALGCAQMEQLPEFIRRKRALAEAYRQSFAGLDGVHFLVEPEECESNYWLNAVLLDDADPVIRDIVLQETNNAGFMTRPAWTLLHRLPMYCCCPKMDLSIAENIADRIINLPSGPKILMKSNLS